MSQRLRLWQDRIQTEVEVRGTGPPLVYLHGPWGLAVDLPFIERLAAVATVYAPRHPGTTPGDPDAIHQLDDVYDLVVYATELLERLEVPRPVPILGHSVGGMLACELAAAVPGWVSRLVLIDPVGVWRDDRPVKNWMILSDAERRSRLFADPDGPAAQAFFQLPEDRDQRAEAQAAFIWAQACTAKFVWPLPDRGLRKRLHRIGVPTLLIWGARDGIVAPDYAQEFAARLSGACIEQVEDAGHLPHLEQPDVVQARIAAFLHQQ